MSAAWRVAASSSAAFGSSGSLPARRRASFTRANTSRRTASSSAGVAPGPSSALPLDRTAFGSARRSVDAISATAAIAVQNYGETLYRLLQLAVRSSLGKRSLDEVLADKVDIEPESAATVRREMAALGVEVSGIALKDIILPGEIRNILNQVVAAEKQAQANLIRRREETAATRSLLNTAKLMEDNPTLIRLKELETLERLTEKVGTVNVHGGFDGLLSKLLPS